MPGECEKCGEHCLDCLCDEGEGPFPENSADIYEIHKIFLEWCISKNLQPSQGLKILCEILLRQFAASKCSAIYVSHALDKIYDKFLNHGLRYRFLPKMSNTQLARYDSGEIGNKWISKNTEK